MNKKRIEAPTKGSPIADIIIKRLSRPVLFLVFFALFFSTFYLFSPKTTLSASLSTEVKMSVNLGVEESEVTKEIIITNNGIASEVLTEYKLVLGTSEPTNISAKINERPITVTKTKENNKTVLKINLSSEVIEKGQKSTIVLKYDDSTILFVNNNKYTASIPQFSVDSGISKLTLTFLAPKKWGMINYSSVGFTYKEDTDKQIMTFTDEFAVGKDILVVFADSQSYIMSLKYYINNPGSSDVVRKIAVPNDQIAQSVVWISSTDIPEYSYVDQDKNLILAYVLKPKEEKTLVFKFFIKVVPKPQKNSNSDLTKSEIETYTKPNTFWGTTDPTIISLAGNLTLKKNSNSEKARAIINYLKSKLSYSEQSVLNSSRERRGGIFAINNPADAIAVDYVDSFVTIARASSIPSRAVAGFAIPDSSSIESLPSGVLHTWAEFWDETEKTWVSVDPTWEDTSGLVYFGNLGLTRATWITYGVSSSSPILPVGYNVVPVSGGLNAFMTVTSIDKETKPELGNLTLKNSISAGQSQEYNISVENSGAVTLTDLVFKLNAAGNSKQVDAFLKAQIAKDDEGFKKVLTPGQSYDYKVVLQNGIIEQITGSSSPTNLTLYANYAGKEVSSTIGNLSQTSGNIVFSTTMIILIFIGFAFIVLLVILVRTFIYKRFKIKNRTHTVNGTQDNLPQGSVTPDNTSATDGTAQSSTLQNIPEQNLSGLAENQQTNSNPEPPKIT